VRLPWSESLFSCSRDTRDHLNDNRTLGAFPGVRLNRSSNRSIQKLFAGGDLDRFVFRVQRETDKLCDNLWRNFKRERFNLSRVFVRAAALATRVWNSFMAFLEWHTTPFLCNKTQPVASRRLPRSFDARQSS
jgi:hypothetical protein